VAVTAVAAALAVRYVVIERALPPGPRRLAALVPSLVLLVAAPLAFSAGDHPLARGPLTSLLSWWAAQKVLLLGVGRGPLQASEDSPLSVLPFSPHRPSCSPPDPLLFPPPQLLLDAGRASTVDIVVFTLLPAYPDRPEPSAWPGGSGQGYDSAMPTPTLSTPPSTTTPSASVSGAVGLSLEKLRDAAGAARRALSTFNAQDRIKVNSLALALAWGAVASASAFVFLLLPDMPPNVKNWGGLSAMLGLLGAVEALGSFVAKALTGVDTVDSFTNPYFPTSLSDFWRRWNLFSGLLMRDLVLRPVLDSSLVPPPSSHLPRCRPPAVVAAAVLGTFLASGLAHVWVAWLVTGNAPWFWMGFFGSHGAIVVAEGIAAKFARGRLKRRARSGDAGAARCLARPRDQHKGAGMSFEDWRDLRLPGGKTSYVAYRLVTALAVDAVCIALASSWWWWTWFEASGMEALMAGDLAAGTVSAIGKLGAPGHGLAAWLAARLDAFRLGAGGPICPSTWLSADQAARTCAAVAERSFAVPVDGWTPPRLLISVEALASALFARVLFKGQVALRVMGELVLPLAAWFELEAWEWSLGL